MCSVVVLCLHEVPAAAPKLARKKTFAVHHAVPFWRRDIVERELSAYAMKAGNKNAFDLKEYNALPKAYAVRGPSLLKIESFIRALLAGAPAGEVCLIPCTQQFL